MEGVVGMGNEVTDHLPAFHYRRSGPSVITVSQMQPSVPAWRLLQLHPGSRESWPKPALKITRLGEGWSRGRQGRHQRHDGGTCSDMRNRRPPFVTSAVAIQGPQLIKVILR